MSQERDSINRFLSEPLERSSPMPHSEIREIFLGYFERKGHKRIKSASLVPVDDPTLLIINSGMAPLKKFFKGEQTPETKRLTNIQKCVRTNDVERVGDNRHLTFFEMMGNWSIGDYFKTDALHFAWELLTDEFKFDRDRLSVTVYGGDPLYPNIPSDEESYRIWQELGLSTNRIYRLGAEHNFWGPAGDSGPCGPCSEVFYDFGQDLGCKRPTCGPDCDCGRFIEIWNPGVFMQYNKDAIGNITELPFTSIDAGAGLERFAMILQNVDSVYETDLLKPIKDSLVSENNVTNTEDEKTIIILRIMTDHVKSAVFMMGDGIYPSNTKREYVVRRLIRRMVTNSRLIGITNPKIKDAMAVIVENFGVYYPEILGLQPKAQEMFEQEVRAFSRTLDRSEKMLEVILKRSGGVVSGKDAFRLQDTFGLPYEIFLSIATTRGFTVNEAEFYAEMEKQREKSRGAKQ